MELEKNERYEEGRYYLWNFGILMKLYILTSDRFIVSNDKIEQKGAEGRIILN